MKIEPRGKYPGVKVHLDEEEVNSLLAGTADNPGASWMTHEMKLVGPLMTRMGMSVRKLLKEMPDLLKPRSDEQIREELELELKKSQKKLEAMKKGKDWKEVRVK